MNAPEAVVRAVEKALGCEPDSWHGHLCITCRVPFPEGSGEPIAAMFTARGCENAVQIADAAVAALDPDAQDVTRWDGTVIRRTFTAGWSEAVEAEE